jgi:hypothetical protein
MIDHSSDKIKTQLIANPRGSNLVQRKYNVVCPLGLH